MPCVRCSAPPTREEQTRYADIPQVFPALNSSRWIVIVFNRDGRVTGCNDYTDFARMCEAVESVLPGEYAEVHAAAPLSPADCDELVPYVAPAATPGDVHIRDDAFGPDDDSDGRTVCDKPMLDRDRWIPVTAPPGAVCAACSAVGPEGSC